MRIYFIIITMFFSISIFGQTIFPGTDTLLISEKTLKVKVLDKFSQGQGYSSFYKDEKLNKKYAFFNGIGSDYNSLVGRVFRVIKIIPYKNVLGYEKYKLKINNPEIGDIYFDYDPRYKFEWHFELVGEFAIPKDFFCRDIEMKVDKFTSEIRYNTPYVSGFSFVKSIKGKNKSIYMAKNESGSPLMVGNKGFLLLLENGKRIEKPDAAIDVKASPYGSSYVYSAFVELNDNDILLLLQNVITDSRLYLFDGTTTKDDGKMIIEYLKCLIEK